MLFVIIGGALIIGVSTNSIHLLSIITYFLFVSVSPLIYSIFSEKTIIDMASFSLVFITIWVSVFMQLTTPLIYKLKFNRHTYFALIFSFLGLGVLSFCVNNLLLFYFFFEVSLIPTFLLIMGWGYQVERVQSVFYFILYTVFASLPLLFFFLRLGDEGLMYFSLTKSLGGAISLTKIIIMG